MDVLSSEQQPNSDLILKQDQSCFKSAMAKLFDRHYQILGQMIKLMIFFFFKLSALLIWFQITSIKYVQNSYMIPWFCPTILIKQKALSILTRFLLVPVFPSLMQVLLNKGKAKTMSAQGLLVLLHMLHFIIFFNENLNL